VIHYLLVLSLSGVTPIRVLFVLAVRRRERLGLCLVFWDLRLRWLKLLTHKRVLTGHLLMKLHVLGGEFVLFVSMQGSATDWTLLSENAAALTYHHVGFYANQACFTHHLLFFGGQWPIGGFKGTEELTATVLALGGLFAKSLKFPWHACWSSQSVLLIVKLLQSFPLIGSHCNCRFIGQLFGSLVAANHFVLLLPAYSK